MGRFVFNDTSSMNLRHLVLFFILSVGYPLYGQPERLLVEEGNSLYQLRDYKGAMDAYGKAIEINPRFSLAYNNRGIVRSHLGDQSGAIQEFTLAIENDSLFFMAYVNRASSLYQTDQFYAAISDYSEAIRINMSYAPAWYGRGIAHIRIQYMVGACADLKKALELGFEEAAEIVDEYCQ